MHSHTTREFRERLAALPPQVQAQARDAYRRFSVNLWHPSLQFKRVHPTDPIWSVRIGTGFRALGRRQGDLVIWFWIGSHADYDRLIGVR